MTRFASVVLVDEDGRVLLQERDEHPAIDPEKWSFCGGHLEPGEDFEAAAYRELEEETGIRLGGGLELFGEFSVFHEHTATHDTFQMFVAGCDLSNADIECHEGRQIVFVDPGEALRLDLSAAARAALPAFLDSAAYAVLTRPADG